MLFIFSLFLVIDLTACNRCFPINRRELPQYELLKSKVRSTQQIVTQKIVEDVAKCREFASSRRALAFNIGTVTETIVGTETSGGRNGERRGGKICQILECPETHNFTTALRDKRYKYYSMYPANVSTEGGSMICVPKAGLFVLVKEHFNYTEASSFCRKLNGTLAHVISEERTTGLARYLTQNVPWFVGLSNRDDERIWKNEFGEPLSCFEYRGWGDGEPSHSRGCATLVNPNTDTKSSWRALPCGSRLPSICEISPIKRRPRNDRDQRFTISKNFINDSTI